MATINKRLYITNKDELFKLVSTIDDKNIKNHFIPFMIAMNDYYNGCRCALKSFTVIAKKEYNKIVDDEIMLNMLKDKLSVDIEIKKEDF